MSKILASMYATEGEKKESRSSDMIYMAHMVFPIWYRPHPDDTVFSYLPKVSLVVSCGAFFFFLHSGYAKG